MAISSLKKFTLLVVEDSPTQAARLKHVLCQAGHQVHLAGGAREALALAQEFTHDLVVSDVTMPEIDGFSLCRLLKENPATAELPVLLLTGLSDPADIVRGLEAGADSYLTKPYSDQDLLSRIRFVVDNRRPESNFPAEPLAVNFLGRTHVIKSSREQMLGLLLSTYESAARQNKALLKDQLSLKMQVRELEAEAASPSPAEEQVDRCAQLTLQLEDYRSQLEFLEDIVTDVDAARDHSEALMQQERAEREAVELRLLESESLAQRFAALQLDHQRLPCQVQSLQEEQADLLEIIDQAELVQSNLRVDRQRLEAENHATRVELSESETRTGNLQWNSSLQEERIIDLERRLGEASELVNAGGSVFSPHPIEWINTNAPTGAALQGAFSVFETLGLPALEPHKTMSGPFSQADSCAEPSAPSSESLSGSKFNRKKSKRR